MWTATNKKTGQYAGTFTDAEKAEMDKNPIYANALRFTKAPDPKPKETAPVEPKEKKTPTPEPVESKKAD